jgi:hypothetical protein
MIGFWIIWPFEVLKNKRLDVEIQQWSVVNSFYELVDL